MLQSRWLAPILTSLPILHDLYLHLHVVLLAPVEMSWSHLATMV